MRWLNTGHTSVKTKEVNQITSVVCPPSNEQITLSGRPGRRWGMDNLILPFLLFASISSGTSFCTLAGNGGPPLGPGFGGAGRKNKVTSISFLDDDVNLHVGDTAVVPFAAWAYAIVDESSIEYAPTISFESVDTVSGARAFCASGGIRETYAAVAASVGETSVFRCRRSNSLRSALVSSFS